MTRSEIHREAQHMRLIQEFISGPERDPEAERLDRLVTAMRSGDGEARVMLLDQGGTARGGVAFHRCADNRFHVDLGDGAMRLYVSPADIGRRVFLVAGWPEDELHAGSFSAGECPACGESLEWFPEAGVVACLGDCGWGVDENRPAPIDTKERASA